MHRIRGESRRPRGDGGEDQENMRKTRPEGE